MSLPTKAAGAIKPAYATPDDLDPEAAAARARAALAEQDKYLARDAEMWRESRTEFERQEREREAQELRAQQEAENAAIEAERARQQREAQIAKEAEDTAHEKAMRTAVKMIEEKRKGAGDWITAVAAMIAVIGVLCFAVAIGVAQRNDHARVIRQDTTVSTLAPTVNTPVK